MDLLTYLHITIESGFAMCCMIAVLYINLYDAKSQKVPKILTCGLIVTAVANIADALSYFLDGVQGDIAVILVRAGNFAVFAGEFVFLALAAMLLDQVLKEKDAGKDKRLLNAVYAIAAGGIIILLASLPFGFLYRFDENNLYYRGKAYALIPLLMVAMIVLMIIWTLKERSVFNKKERVVFTIFFLLNLAGAVLETAYVDISFSMFAASISLFIVLYIFMKEAASGVSVKRRFILSAEGIESISADIDRFLIAMGTERQNRIRIRFTIEDALYRIWQEFDEPNMVKVVASIVLRKPVIRIEQEGEPFNPFSNTKNPSEDWSSGLLASAGLSPAYSYSHGYNVIKIGLNRMRINPVITIILSILFGLIIGTVALVSLSEADVQFVAEGLLVPVYDLWNNLLYSVSAPAMFIIVMSTMLDTREVSDQGGNAGMITGRYFVISLLLGLFTFAGGFLVSAHSYMFDPVTRNTVSELIRKLFSIIPQNFFDPIKDFNTAQLILMGIVLAYATMAVGQQASGISSIIHELNLISAQLAAWISAIMPVFTVFLTAQLVLQHNSALLLILLKIIPFALVLSIVIMIGTLLVVSWREHADAIMLLRKLWPSFIQTIRTGQVTDTYAMAERCCIKDLGIRKVFTERMMPLGLVLYMPVSIIGMTAFVLFAAFISNVAITPMWIITAIVFALILTIAAPPIPGVNILSYVVIVGQLGLDMKFILVAVIFDVVFNVFASAANQMMLQLDLILQADRVGMLSHPTLIRGKAEQ